MGYYACGAFIYQNYIKLSDKEDRYKISNKFDWGPLSTIGMRVTCAWGPLDLEKYLDDSNLIFYQIFIWLTSNEDSYKI